MNLKPGRAPSHRLKNAFSDLPQGTFVNPVDRRHLPKHILDDKIPSWFDPKETAACFTPIGFLLIPWVNIEIV